MRNAYKIMFVKHEKRKSVEISRHRWKDKINRNLMKIWCYIVDWVYQVQDRDPLMASREHNSEIPCYPKYRELLD
jgi:hypothetical protein